MQETQRLAYLEAMGVDSYFPRLQLPGARPSPLCPLPVVRRQLSSPVENATESISETGRKTAHSARRDLNLADMLGDVAPKPAAHKATRGPEPAREATVEIERFSLRFVHSSSGVLVIDSALEPPPEKALLRFVAQVIFALSGERDASLRCSPFQWPIADNPQLDHSAQAARETLHSSIGANIERDQVRLVLVMGEIAQRYLSGAATHWPGVSLLGLSDSQRLMSSGTEKAAVWMALQSLSLPD